MSKNGNGQQSIQALRRRIDKVDDELLRLLFFRAGLATKVGHLKRRKGMSAYSPTREREIIAARGPDEWRPATGGRGETHLPPDRAGIALGRHSRGGEMSARVQVAFQGEHGAFSEEAALRLLGAGTRLVPRPTFESCSMRSMRVLPMG